MKIWLILLPNVNSKLTKNSYIFLLSDLQILENIYKKAKYTNTTEQNDEK